jgi:hypothetical protein
MGMSVYKSTKGDMTVSMLCCLCRVSSVMAITNWLKEQPYTKVERHVCGSEILEAEFVQSIEREVDEFQHHGCRGKTVIMQVKPHLLYKVRICLKVLFCL